MFNDEYKTSGHNNHRFVWRALVIGTALATGLVGCSSPAQSGEPSSTNKSVASIKLGAIFPLTGATAQNGTNSLRGVQLAVDTINAAGGIKSMGGAKIELLKADSTSDAAAAASAAEQFLSTGDKPLAIIGVFASALTTTVARVTERAKVPLLSTSFSDDLTKQGYKYFFQVTPQASKMGTAQMNDALEMAKAANKPIQNVAIVYANNAYGVAQAAALKTQAESNGKTVVSYEGYDPTITDAGPIVSKITASNPDAIFSIAYVSDGVLLMRALKAQGVTVPIFGGTGGYVTADFGKALGDLADGLFTVTTSNPDGFGDFGAAYEKKYGEFMAAEADSQAAAVYVFAQELEKHPTTDPTVLAENLHKGSYDEGAAAHMPGGVVKFNDVGLNVNAVPLMVQWQGGKLVGVWPSDVVKGKPIWAN